MSFIAQSVEITLKDIYGIYDFGFIGNDYDEIWDSLKVPSDFCSYIFRIHSCLIFFHTKTQFKYFSNYFL